MTPNETDIPQQTVDGSKITAKQLTNHCNFHVLMINQIMTKLINTNNDQRHKHHHLTTTLHLTLKMTTAQVVETSVTNNSLSKDYPHPEDHTKQVTDTPGFKPFTKNNPKPYYIPFHLCFLRLVQNFSRTLQRPAALSIPHSYTWGAFCNYRPCKYRCNFCDQICYLH